MPIFKRRGRGRDRGLRSFPGPSGPKRGWRPEFHTFQFAPFWVYQVVTGTEGPVDEEELWAFLLHEFSEAKLLSKVGELNRLVFSSAVGEFSDVMERFAADSRAPLEGLEEAARLMEAEFPAAAPEFKDALLMLARNVAKRSKRYRVVDFETFRSATEAQRDAMTRPISAAAREHGVSAVAEALGLKV